MTGAAPDRAPASAPGSTPQPAPETDVPANSAPSARLLGAAVLGLSLAAVVFGRPAARAAGMAGTGLPLPSPSPEEDRDKRTRPSSPDMRRALARHAAERRPAERQRAGRDRIERPMRDDRPRRHAGIDIEPRADLRLHLRGAGPAAVPETRLLYTAAAMLAASVLSDSAMEHYRGDFENPGMFAPLASAGLVLATALAARWQRPDAPAPRPVRLRASVAYGAACAIGVAGLGFHLYNVGRRPGGFSWGNLFYAAPLGAPGALSLAGLLGLAAQQVDAGATSILTRPSGQALCALAAFGLVGNTAEVALLHFRGAYQHKAMWVPVTVPPVGAALLAAAALSKPARPGALARIVLKATTWIGMIGMGFHARGIARQMGGWANWSQNLFSGPPLPAPPSFTALALAGQAALTLRARDASYAIARHREAT